MSNRDDPTIASFGDEWSRFDQQGLTDQEAQKTFFEYFHVFPWDALPHAAQGFDMGCGSGRWARFVAPRVGKLACIDPSLAIDVARRTLADHGNVAFIQGSVDQPSLPAASQDFGYALGVLHHIPDTQAAISSCVALLKPGAPFLLYLYYAFDGRPSWFRALWRCSDLLRRMIFRLPPSMKHIVTDLIAALVYWPLARGAVLGEKVGWSMSAWPLSYYRAHSFYTMRTDARDRFGTPLEQRFTKAQIESMMASAGLTDIVFSDRAPFWCAVGYRAK